MKKLLALILTLVMVFPFQILTKAATIDAVDPDAPVPYNISLSTDGTVSWSCEKQRVINGTTVTYEPKYFRVQLYKVTLSTVVSTGQITYSASKKGSERKVNADEREVSLNIGSAGYYFAAVRVENLLGSFSGWGAPDSNNGNSNRSGLTETDLISITDINLTTITSDDTSSGGGSSSGSGSTSGGPGTNSASNNTQKGPGVIDTVGGQTKSGTTSSNGKGWIKDAHGTYYVKNDGTYIKDTWAEIDGYYYRFNKYGYIRNNCWYYENSNGHWYYLDASGHMLTGPQYINGKFYYLNPVKGTSYGAMACNEEVQINGIYYAYGADGAMITNANFNNHFYNAGGARVK